MTRCPTLLLAALVLAGCGEPAKLPGDEVLGTFALHSKGIFSACSLPGFPVSYDFEGTFSRFADGGRVFFTAGPDRFDATFDGQLATYGQTAGGSFGLADGGNCNQCEMKQVQTATVALLSASQSRALGDACPTTALDGGIPSADDDAGITLPGRTDGGFDAVRACGELQVLITGEGFCDSACYSCRLVYRVSGERRK